MDFMGGLYHEHIEFEEYPEPKSLSADELRVLHKRYKSFYRVGDVIGASEAFARQGAKLT